MQKPNLQNVTLKISAGTPRQFARDPMPQVAFAGRSNVGKSSLINTLLGRKSLARVSSAPGKTVTLNFYDIDRKLFFVDLPGYGFALRSTEEKRKWSELTDGYFTGNPDRDLLKLVLLLVDSRIGATDDDLFMLDYIIGAKIPFAVVMTKIDKLNTTERNNNIPAITENLSLPEGAQCIPFSSKTGEGRDTILNLIYKYCL